MTFPSFGQNWIWLGLGALQPGFSHFHHDFIPGRIHFLAGGHQPGGGLAIADDLHPLSAFGPVQHGRRLFMQLLGSDLRHGINRHQNRVAVKAAPGRFPAFTLENPPRNALSGESFATLA